MTYYAIIEKETGIMAHGLPNFREDTDRPINTDELMYVELNDRLVKTLVSTDPADHENEVPIDFNKSHWDFNTSSWVIVDLVLENNDPVQVQLDIRNKLIADANKKLAIEDLPSSLKTILSNYIAELNAVEVTAETSPTIVWPQLPV